MLRHASLLTKLMFGLCIDCRYNRLGSENVYAISALSFVSSAVMQTQLCLVLQVAKHQKAYMHVAHALLAWHMQKPGVLSPNWPTRFRRAKPFTLLQTADASSTASMQNHADETMPASASRQHPTMGSASQAHSQQAAEQTHSAKLDKLNGSSVQQHDGAGADQHLQCCSSRQQTDVSQHHQTDAHNRDVSLSCSLDEEMLPELDADVSSRLQPCPSQLTNAKGKLHSCVSDGTLHGAQAMDCGSEDAPQSCVGSSNLHGGQSVCLTVRTSQSDQAVSLDAVAQLQHEMAVSPSAQQGRRKQARLGSMRSLKF